MFNIEIIAIGKLKQKSPLFDVWADYVKRVPWTISLIEEDAPNTPQEHQKILSHMKNGSFRFVLDEKGQSMPSLAFSQTLQKQLDHGQKNIQFVIGGSNGLSDEIREKANILYSFGKQTWPHMLSRIMLIEQIYRAYSIQTNHPYHREG